MRKLLITSAFILNACQTTGGTLVSENGQHTIGFFTGSSANDTHFNYGEAFTEEAAKKCEQGYEVVYRGREPSTIAPALRDSTYFYWVVQCH